MANSRSARKRIRANERKHLRNRSVRSAVRTKITKARRALLGTEVGATTEEHVLAAVQALDRAAEKGILHRNNTARRKSRLMSMANRLRQAAASGEEATARAAAAGGQKGRSGRAASGTGTKGAASKSAASRSTTKAGAASTTARGGSRGAAKTTTKTTTKTTGGRAKKA